MTFATLETSADSGRPVELLEIVFGPQVWRYTTAEINVTYNGFVYTPIPMSRSSLSPSSDIAKASLTIKLPQDAPVGNLFRSQPPSGLVTFTLYAEHAYDNSFQVLWKGRVINAEWEQPWLSLITENIFSSLQRVGLRRKYSSQCPFALYSQDCSVSQEAFKTTATVTSLSGNVVTCASAAGKGVNWFSGGFMQWTNPDLNSPERRMVKAYNTATGAITLASLPNGLVVGSQVNIYPGCDHSVSTCESKFANSLNFGGMPYIPKKNPFGGSTIY